MIRLFVPIVLVTVPAFTNDLFAICTPVAVQGVYGFQLSGDTRISSGGAVKPVVSVGRLVLDGAGHVSGYSSVNFAGYFLGNPVTGTYTTGPDCSISWSLQDDSGAYQHLAGTVGSDGTSVQFSQTDAGSAKHGTMAKSADSCGTGNLQRDYDLTVSGSTFSMEAGRHPRSVSLRGVALVDPNGNVNLIPAGSENEDAAGTVHVDSNCFAQIDLSLPSQPLAEMTFRGILVDGGKEILGIETDPGTAVTMDLSAR